MALTLVAASLLGFLTGLGIGGGSLLILWLTLAADIDPIAARGINLLFFLPAAAISCIFRCRQGTLCWKTSLPSIISGCLAAAVFSFLSLYLRTEVLRKGFGVLLLVTGIRELLYRPKE